MIARAHPFGRLVFDRGAIVRAALRAYVENILSRLDPLGRHNFTACAEPDWTGDLQHGAFYNGNGCGDYAVVAWTEAGVVGLAYELGFGPLEQLGLSVDAVTRGPDDVRAALPELPSELEPALVMAAAMLPVGSKHGEKLAGAGFWRPPAGRVGRAPRRSAPAGVSSRDRRDRSEARPDDSRAYSRARGRGDRSSARWPHGAHDGRDRDADSHPARPGATARRPTDASESGHHLARLARDPRGAAANRGQPLFTAALIPKDRDFRIRGCGPARGVFCPPSLLAGCPIAHTAHMIAAEARD